MYNASAPLTNLGTVDAYHDVNDTALVPIVVEAMPLADRTIELEFLFATMDDGTNHGLFNNVTYNAPLVPSILSTLTLGNNATVATAYGPTSFIINHLEVYDIVLKNADTGKHPL